MNAYLHSMRYRALKHGSEEEYGMFEEIAICLARNRRMHGAADSKLQLQRTAATTGEDDSDTAEHTRRDANEQAAAEDSPSCAGDGNRSQEKDSNVNTLNAAAKNEVRQSSAVGHPRANDHVCTKEELCSAGQPHPSTSSSTSSDHDSSVEYSKERGELWQTCCLQ